MKTVTVEPLTLQGISIRTNNANEMNPESAKIAGLHQQFDQHIKVDYESGARVYGVYYHYDSDDKGDFSVLAGADHIASADIPLETVTLQKGRYKVFEGRGKMPEAVIQAWQAVWEYFSDETHPEVRAYTTDFEHYISETEVDVHIAIEEK